MEVYCLVGQFTIGGIAHPVAGNLKNNDAANEIFTDGYGSNGLSINAYDSDTTNVTGWPKNGTASSTPASTADIDNDGIDEIFTYFMESTPYSASSLRCYKANGTVCPGWPVNIGFVPYAAPAIGDINKDGKLDIIISALNKLFAFNSNGTSIPGFPVTFPNHSTAGTSVAVGDVDGDLNKEIILVGSTIPDVNWQSCERSYPVLHIFSSTGTLKKSLIISDVQNKTAHKPALGDLDGDNIPEIVLQTQNSLIAIKGDGTVHWGIINDRYQNTTSHDLQGNSAPVIGDINGDGKSEIVILTGSKDIKIKAYNEYGQLLPQFPIILNDWNTNDNVISEATVPAIYDIDNDGRNEIVIVSNFIYNFQLTLPKVWAFDLGASSVYGPVQWSQYSRDENHTSFYLSNGSPRTIPAYDLRTDTTAPNVAIVQSYMWNFGTKN